MFFFDLCFDDHGSSVIFRSVSVRPRHLFDLYFDYDYFFKLPLQGAGCPIMWTAFYFTPCPVPSCPAYEPNSNDCEYSQPFRHIQYKRTPSLRPRPCASSCARNPSLAGTASQRVVVHRLQRRVPIGQPPILLSADGYRPRQPFSSYAN